MAKSKTKAKTKTKQVDDEEQMKDRAEPAEEEAVDLEDIDAEKRDDAEGPEDKQPDSVDDKPSAPPAKISKLTLALILLNWIAAPTFLIFAGLDYQVRTQFAYRTMVNYITVWGLPLKSEEDADGDYTPLSIETRARIRLTPDQIKAAFKKRPGAKAGSTEFLAVDEPVPLKLRPSDMLPELLQDVFDKHPDPPVATLDDEILRLTSRLPDDIKKAAENDAFTKLKTDDEKRAAIHKVLLPIAFDVRQVRALDETIAKTNGKYLDEKLEDAVQRRMYYDILAPINIFRPGDIEFKNFNIEKLADWDAYPLDKVKEFMKQRLDASLARTHDLDVHIGEIVKKEMSGPDALKRDSVERRQKIAFILFTLSQVMVPTTDKRLYPKGVERAQIVSGLYEFTNSSIHYVRAMRILEERIVSAISADRQGWVTDLKDKPGQFTTTPGFIDEFEEEVDRLVKIVHHIDSAAKRKTDLLAQRDGFQKIYDQRIKQHKDTLERLVIVRKNTEKYAKDLRSLQDQLHTALVELSDAGDRNLRLYEEIREIELNYLRQEQKKGGKKKP